MPPKDDSPGLLSKVVRFVKNPTTNWSDLDQQDTERESAYSKQMLKEMIERKRRNDFVRKREFDMLRKMRRSEVMAGSDPGARPSFFQSSMPSRPDDRASTLKKIDEIEAQMSMQWWKTKHADAGASGRTGGSAFPVSTHMPPEPGGRPLGNPQPKPSAYTRTEPAPLLRQNEKTEPADLSALQAPRPSPARPPVPAARSAAAPAAPVHRRARGTGPRLRRGCRQRRRGRHVRAFGGAALHRRVRHGRDHRLHAVQAVRHRRRRIRA